MRNERTKHVAFTKLFGLASPYGLRNKALLRNLGIVERYGLTEAAPYLEPLSERKDILEPQGPAGGRPRTGEVACGIRSRSASST